MFQKIPEKLPWHISVNCPCLVTLWVVVQKIYSKMHPVSQTNTNLDITDLVNHGMVKNTKKKQHVPQLTHFQKLSFCSRCNL